MSESRPRASILRGILLWSVLAVLVGGTIEGLSILALRYLEQHREITFEPFPFDQLIPRHVKQLKEIIGREPEYEIIDPDLGWTIKPGGAARLYRANSAGIRADREYSLMPPANVIRIAAFGDSFTHCDDVVNTDTWEEKLAAITANTEVLNFGVAGYGTDQAFLRYQQHGRAFHPQIVLIGFMSSDINRNVVRYVPFRKLAAWPVAKPRFVVDETGLRLIKNPLRSKEDYRGLLEDPGSWIKRMGENDYWYHAVYGAGRLDFLASVRAAKIAYREWHDDVYVGEAYNTKSEAFVVTTRILQAFRQAVLDDGAEPVILLMPERGDIERMRARNDYKYAPLERWLQQRGYRYLNLLHGFQELAPDVSVGRFFHGHYSPYGNELVARYLKARLSDGMAVKVATN